MGFATLCLVDDAEDFRRAMHAALEEAGFRVRSYASAEALLDALDQPMSSGADLFVVDLRLPGLQGEDLVRRLLRRDPTARVLVISGAGIGVEEELGVGPVLEKPFRVADLLGRCETLLRR